MVTETQHGIRRAAPRAGLAALAVAGLVLLGGCREAARSESWAYDLTHELMSPYGAVRHSIADCPSASHLVEQIVALEQEGRSRDEVEEMLYAQFGDVLRPAPKAEGFGLTAYLIPVLAALAGAALLYAFLRPQLRGREREVEEPPALAPVDPELERLVDEELKA